jgi:hypothetical protein
MFIAELFEPGKDWKWSFTGSEEAVAVFHVGEVPYQFHAYTYPGEEGSWEVEFKNADRKLGRSTKFGLTGTGNSAEVMSTIADIMREFLQRYQGKVTTLTFTAEEESRKSLYARMAKRLLPDWTLKHNDKMYWLTAPLDVNENFADGKKPGRKGLAKRSGVNCKQSVTKLRAIAKKSTGEKRRMAHWCANMKAGKKR